MDVQSFLYKKIFFTPFPINVVTFPILFMTEELISLSKYSSRPEVERCTWRTESVTQRLLRRELNYSSISRVINQAWTWSIIPVFQCVLLVVSIDNLIYFSLNLIENWGNSNDFLKFWKCGPIFRLWCFLLFQNTLMF